MMRILVPVLIAIALLGCDMRKTRPEAEKDASGWQSEHSSRESEAGLQEYQLDEKSFDDKTLAMIQSDSGITIPPGSRGISFYYKPPIDPGWAAKIEIPKDATAAMTAQLSAIQGKTINITGELGPRMPWWRKLDSPVLFDRQSSPGGDYLRTTLADESGSIILYIEWDVF